MAEKKSLELFLFTDEPARELTGDHLALEPFSSMVAAAALTNRGPFNIGVFSGWGQGKTTVLRQAQALVAEQEKPNVITAWVNAWQYEHEAHPIVPLLAIIINEITKAIDARKSVSEEENAALAKTFGDLKRALRSIAYGFSAKAGATIPGFANLEIGFVAKDMIDRDEKLSSDRDPLLDQSLYYHAYDRLEKFREQLAATTPAAQPKIIVFIDDLDRCLPSKALHLLESLKLVLAQPGFIFVLAVDRHVIDSFLTKRYHDDFGISQEKGHGKQYMDKIIQLPLDLPHHQNRFEKYIGKLIKNTTNLPTAFRQLFADQKDGPAFISALAAGCDRTPRTLIRTLNYLLTDYYLRENAFFDQIKDPFTESAEFLQFAAVSRIARITFGSEHTRLYRTFVNSELACDSAATVFSATKNTAEKLFGDGSETLGDLGESGPKRFSTVWSIISESDSLKELLESDIGHRWLKEHAKRQAIEGYLATREEPDPAIVEDSRQIINFAIREKLGLSENQGIGDEDLQKITELKLDGALVSNVTALKNLTNLQTLDLSDTLVSDVTALKNLTSLKTLELRGTQVSDVTALKNLTCLQTLDLRNTLITNVTELKTLTSLQGLYLSDTQVGDVTALNNLTSLQTLYLDATQVCDITPLKTLTSLQILYLSFTQVRDVTALYWLKNCLKELNLHLTPVSENKAAMDALREALPLTKISHKLHPTILKT